MSGRQEESTVCKEGSTKNEKQIEVVANYIPYIFFPTRIVRGVLEGNVFKTERGQYKLLPPTLKEKIIAVLPYLFMVAVVPLITDVVPDSTTGVASAAIGIVGGMLYGLFRPYGLLLLLASLFFGYEYRFAVAYFILSFGITATILFWIKAKKAKQGVYVVIPPRLSLLKRKQD